jgi:hypothetical protein
VAGVEGLDLGPHAELGHHPAHGAQHARRVGHHVVGLGEVHGAAVERADLGQAGGDMGDPVGRADHVGAGAGRQGGLGAAQHQVAAHAGGQVQHHVDLRRADALGDLAVECHVAGGLAGLGVAHVAVHDRRAGLGRVDGACGDLAGRARHVGRAVLRAARAGDGAGDEDVAVHGERHGLLP